MDDLHQDPSVDEKSHVAGDADAWVSACLQELALADESLMPPDRLEQSVMARWDTPQSTTRARLPAVPRWAGVFALSVVVGLMGWVFTRTRVTPVSDPLTARRGSTEPGTSLLSLPASEFRPALAEKTPLDLRRRSHGAPVNQTEQLVQPVSEFVALDPFSETMTGDDLEMFRVRLSRAALPSLGVPIDDTGSTGVVEADVLFGTDGVARAIRFVR